MKTQRNLFIAFFVCIVQTLLSQSKNKIEKYYQLTNKAELEICSNHFSEAYELYKKAFDNLSQPFTHDLYNAFICSYLLNKPVYKYYKNIRERGVSKNFFAGNQLLNAKTIDSLEQLNKIRPTYDKQYRDSVQQMAKRDQQFRIIRVTPKQYDDTIRKIDEENGKALLSIVQRRGFPSEDMIGNDSMNITAPIYQGLMFHHVKGARFQSVNFSSILSTAIKLGKLDNRTGCDLMDFSDGTDRFGTNAAGVCYIYWQANYNADSLAHEISKSNHPWYIADLEESAVKRYSQERPIYFLDGIFEYRKKILFQMKNPQFDLGLYDYKFVGGFVKKEEYEYALKGLKEVK